MKTCKPEYLEKVLILSTQEKERLQSRMTGKLPRKLDRRKVSLEEALALQLEIEDELLNEWRERMHELRAKELKKAAKASEGDEKPQTATEEKSIMKVAATVEAKAPAKPKKQAAPKSSAKPAKPAAKSKPAK